MQRACVFCEHDASLHTSEASACERCALRIADLAADPSEDIWAEHAAWETKARNTVALVGAPCSASDREFERLKEEVEQQIAVDDADSHLALSEAYTQMGLYLDARREAGVALRAWRKPSTTAGALARLLTEPLLPRGGLRRLRERLAKPLH